MPARFYEQETRSGLKDKRKLSAYLEKLVKRELKGIKKVAISYIFCTDEALLEMNRQFLEHNTYTDIVTFDLSESENEVVSDIYISVDRVKENAAKFKVSYTDELHRVIFHGALHLCGYKDKTKADKEEMRKQEDKCLQQYKKA